MELRSDQVHLGISAKFYSPLKSFMQFHIEHINTIATYKMEAICEGIYRQLVGLSLIYSEHSNRLEKIRKLRIILFNF